MMLKPISSKSRNNTPLSNLFVRLLQQTGIEAEQFGASEGILNDI